MGQTIRQLLQRPGIWAEAVRAAWAHRRRRWWLRFPFLPLPAGSYFAWRRATAYGTSLRPLQPDDVVAYLQWRRRERRAR